MKYLMFAMVTLALAGCAYPTSSIEQGADRGQLSFVDLPVGAAISVDGQQRGVQSSTSAIVVSVEAGKHAVEEAIDGHVSYHADYYVGAGSVVEVRSTK